MKTKLILLVAVLLMAVAPLARGDVIELTLINGATTVTVADGGAGDGNPLAGVITYVGPVGVWNINVSTGIMDPVGSPVGSLDLNSVDSTPTGVGNLIVKLTRIGMMNPVYTSFQLDIGGTIVPGASTVTYQAFRDQTNAPYGEAELIATIGPASGTFSGTVFGVLPAVATVPYSLTQVITIDPVRAATTISFDASLQPVPEPGTGILLGLGVLALGTVLRRRLV